MIKCGKEEVNEELDKEIEVVEKKVKKKVPVVEKLNNLKQKNESFVNELKTVAVNDNVPSRIYHCKKCKTDYNLRKSYMRHIGLTCERRRSKAKLLLQSVEKMEAKTNLKPQIKNETTDSIKPHINKTNGSLFKKQPVPKKSGSNYRTCKICRKQFSTKYTLARHIRTLECSLKRKQLAGGSMPRRQKLKTH
ncbi:hypothetical protein LSTR_LSTR000945 [Laodelphax striatellus]|uniref:C2H2-type domain-containing protein n=1 Tax=Laodelphax striatellus TaxID=195883 RepID=A0A482X0T2_LAOST|nr:hypothetical protein LSTR_LSTR000945 [Laodelphax striatellus]